MQPYSHILQLWCNCGSGVVGEVDEAPFIENFRTEHKKYCRQEFSNDQPMKISYGTQCGIRIYGPDTASAAEDFNFHQEQCRTCLEQPTR